MSFDRVVALALIAVGLIGAAAFAPVRDARAQNTDDAPYVVRQPSQSWAITDQQVVPLSAEQQRQQQQPPQTAPYTMRRGADTPRIMPRPAETFPVQTNTRDGSSNPNSGTMTRPAGTAIAPSLIAPTETRSPAGLPVMPAEAAPQYQPAYQRPPEQNERFVPDVTLAPTQRTVQEPRRQPVKPANAPKSKIAAARNIAPIPPHKPPVKTAATQRATPPAANTPLAATTSRVAQGTTQQHQEQHARPAAQHNAAPNSTAQNPAGLPPSNIPPPAAPARRVTSRTDVLASAPKTMPAVPSRHVGAEQLPAVPGIAVADADDPLLLKLKDFNRDNFVRNIEDITSRIAAPKPARKPQRGGMPPPLSRDNRAIANPQSATTRAPANEQARSQTNSTPPQQMAALHSDTPARSAASITPSGNAPRMPPADGEHESAFLSVPFVTGVEKADQAVLTRIEADVLPLLRQNPQWRLQIQAFSSPDNNLSSSARRIALARAISVREYLVQKGIAAPRLDIRALGAETDRDPLDRIDLIFFDPAHKS